MPPTFMKVIMLAGQLTLNVRENQKTWKLSLDVIPSDGQQVSVFGIKLLSI